MTLSLLSQNLIALERHYHKSCHREYTQKVQNLLTTSNESQSSRGTNLYKNVNCKELRAVVKEHYEQIIEVPKILRYHHERLNKKVSPKKFER